MATLAHPAPRTIAPPSAPPLTQRLGRVFIYALLITVGLILFTPFILAFLGTFKTDAEIIAWPPTFLPTEWHVENWPRLWNTDVGGLPRPAGATSLGLSAGVFVFFVVFLLVGLSSGDKNQKSLSRAIGLPLSLALALAAGAGSALYLRIRLVENANPVLLWTVGIAVTVFALIGVGILSMSQPDWRRVLLAMVGALVVGLLMTIVFERLAIQAGGGRFVRWLFNTALLSVIRAFVMVIFCSMAAYAFARMRFPGKNLIFNFMLASMMIPSAVTLIPKYVLIAKLGWVNTAYALIFPSIVDAFGIFMLTQFLKAVPRELEEAAFIDGASYFQIYKDVVLPLARPALLTLFIFQFQGMWNDFLPPLLYLNTPDMWVMNVALSVFQQQYTTQWNLTLVGAMLSAIVPLTIFFFFSRYYIEGVSYAGVKG
ncbi:MAG: carbohydrate ABC transporter permease [Anaerolineales bacterium]